MKILHIINSLATGGAEKLIAETIPLYNEKGIQADVLVLNSAKYPLFEELEEKKCCRVFSLGNSSVYNPIHIFKIIPYLKKYDLVHVHLFPALYFVALAKIISRAKLPLIFTEHSTNNRRFKEKKYQFLDKIIYSTYTKIVCITQEVKHAVISQTNLKENRLMIIENGVNLQKIEKAKSLSRINIDKNITETDFLLIQVSSFQEPKDQATLIKSLQYLPENVKLLLIGDGVLRKNCEQLVEDLKLKNRIFFLGIRNDVPSLLKTADVVVLSSKYEGLSLSSIEGMASGKPFVASNVPGLAEIVKNAGILFLKSDEKKLAEEIQKLLIDKDYYTKIAKKCQEKAQQYNIDQMVAQHIKLYKNIFR